MSINANETNTGIQSSKIVLNSIKNIIIKVFDYIYNVFSRIVNTPVNLVPTSSRSVDPTSASHKATSDEMSEKIDSSKILSISWEGDPLDPLQWREDIHEKRANQTISQCQGCRSLRNRTVEVTRNNPKAISPSALRAASASGNQSTYEIVKYKRLAQTFGLSGFLKAKDKDYVFEFNLEGFSDTFTMPMIQESLDDFLALSPKYEKQRTLFATIFSESLNNDNATDERIANAYRRIHAKEKTLPVLIGTGWDWHSTQVIIYKCCNCMTPLYFLGYFNRGVDAIVSGGMLYTIRNHEKITKEWIGKLAKRLSSTQSNYLSQKKIVADLDLKLRYTFPQKIQKKGSCTMSSLKAGLSGLFALDQLSESFEKCIEIDRISVDLENKEWQKTDKMFIDFDKKRLLDDFLSDLKKENPDENAKKMAIFLMNKYLLADERKIKSLGNGLSEIFDFCRKIEKEG